MARKSINFFGLKRLGYIRAGPLPGHKKNGFSVPGNAGALLQRSAAEIVRARQLLISRRRFILKETVPVSRLLRGEWRRVLPAAPGFARHYSARRIRERPSAGSPR